MQKIHKIEVYTNNEGHLRNTDLSVHRHENEMHEVVGKLFLNPKISFSVFESSDLGETWKEIRKQKSIA